MEATLQQAGRGDEVSPVARYILQEMVTNARSLHSERIRQFNRRAETNCLAEFQQMPWWQKLLAGGQTLETCHQTAASSKLLAFADWGLLVRENGPWDHKPIIRKRFNPANPGGEQHFHHLDGYLYFYDIWSNIHYGYVGRACGFSESELLDGAGLEQIGSDIVHGRRPRASPGVQGMRAYDNPSDRLSVQLGSRLYPRTPSTEELVNQVRTLPGLSRRPLS